VELSVTCWARCPSGTWSRAAKGVNIFEVGSKNPGATNVRRVLGKGPGNLVFALDASRALGGVPGGRCPGPRWRDL
jgi:glycerol-3-phosphate acyltransferase PlsY